MIKKPHFINVAFLRKFISPHSVVFKVERIMHHMERIIVSRQTKKEIIMWTTPAATEMRFGFEVTMYVMNK
jgi:coenzyme PQQ precursor peptide PqqA